MNIKSKIIMIVCLAWLVTIGLIYASIKIGDYAQWLTFFLFWYEVWVTIIYIKKIRNGEFDKVVS